MISFVFSIKDASPSLIRFLATPSGWCIIVTTELSLGTSLFSNNSSMIVVAIRSCTHVKYCWDSVAGLGFNAAAIVVRNGSGCIALLGWCQFLFLSLHSELYLHSCSSSDDLVELLPGDTKQAGEDEIILASCSCRRDDSSCSIHWFTLIHAAD